MIRRKLPILAIGAIVEAVKFIHAIPWCALIGCDSDWLGDVRACKRCGNPDA